MSIKSYKESLQKARKVMESAATTYELTTETKPLTKFSIPSDRIQFGMLVFKLRSLGQAGLQVSDNGSTYSIETNNPTQVVQVLKLLGLEADIEGNTEDNVSQSFKVELQSGSNNGTIGEAKRKSIKESKTISETFAKRLSNSLSKLVKLGG
jgi:hypothetical protein